MSSQDSETQALISEARAIGERLRELRAETSACIARRREIVEKLDERMGPSRIAEEIGLPVRQSVAQILSGGTSGASRSRKARVRVQFGLRDLLDSGHIANGERLVLHRRNGPLLEGFVNERGQIVINDNDVYDSPSRAAMAAMQSENPQDGWLRWRLSSTGRTLADVRAEALSQR